MMREPTHHPADETLLRHAAGSLPAGSALVVAAHLEHCPRCRAAVRLGEAVGGVLLADCPEAPLAQDALARSLARLEEPESRAPAPAAGAELAPGLALPTALRGLTDGRWRRVAPGIGRIRLDVPGARSGELVYLLRVAPGRRLPEHGHRGQEITCVLAGRFRDASGVYGPGDVAEMEAGADHQPSAEPGEACICLIATDGRLRMRGLLARALQPLVGV
jgi:putative transcriptional regulator